MMCSKLLRHEQKHGRVYNAIERFLGSLTNGYRRALTTALGLRWAVMLAFVVVAGTSLVLLKALKSELAPVEDRGRVVSIFSGPEGSTIDFMARYAAQVEAIFANTPEVDRYLVISGNPTVSQGISFAGFRDWSERERSAIEISAELRRSCGDPGPAGLRCCGGVRPELAQPPDQLRDHDLESVRRVAPHRDDARRDRQAPGFVSRTRTSS